MDALTNAPAQLTAWVLGLDLQEYWVLLGLCALATVGGAVGGYVSLYRGRLIENTPTSRVRSAAQGFVELIGRAWPMPGEPVLAPLTSTPCCWWRFKVEKRKTVTVNGKRKNVWRTVESDTSDALFLLRDLTGECIVDPEHADVHPDQQQTWYGSSPRPQHPPRASRLLRSGGHYRYSQSMITLGARLYALGAFRTHAGQSLDEDTRQRLANRLREWKQDQAALIARFDSNRDGVIDAAEWTVARAAAQAEVEAERAAEERAEMPPTIGAGHHLLSRPLDGRPFILSTLSERTLVRLYRIGAALGIVLALSGFSALLLALQARGWLA